MLLKSEDRDKFQIGLVVPKILSKIKRILLIIADENSHVAIAWDFNSPGDRSAFSEVILGGNNFAQRNIEISF